MINLKQIPSQPGIYRFLDQNGRLLYIGKAKNLNNRVKSYFAHRTGGQAKTAELTPAKQQMVALIKKIQFTIVTNETEALLLERSLINKYLPPYNIDLKDDKSWLYVMITADEFPKVVLIRKQKKQSNKGVFFGPYTSALAIRQTMRMLKKIFPYYSPNGPMIDLSKNWRSRLHLGRYLNEPITDKTEWQKNLRLIKKFLQGKNEEFKSALHQAMLKQAQQKNFEQAAKTRDDLKYLAMISQKQAVIKNDEVDEQYLNRVKKNFKGLTVLKKILHLKKLPLRIECYDISNIGGQLAVGSMVVLTDGQVDKSQYRKFKIKTVLGANDPAMIGEVIKRRLKNDWPQPDLLVIDGGPTQLNAALYELEKDGRQIPIISLAKREEEIYLPAEAISIKLPKFSPALQLLQRIRDEAHRFAITYYRQRHSKNFLKS